MELKSSIWSKLDCTRADMDSVPWMVVLVHSGGGGGGKFGAAIGVEVIGASGRGLDGVNRIGGTPRLARVLLRGNGLSPSAMSNRNRTVVTIELELSGSKDQNVRVCLSRVVALR
jgi:hypothetical protein